MVTVRGKIRGGSGRPLGGTMTKTEAVKRLNAINGKNSEEAHEEADDILLQYLMFNGGHEVAHAFMDKRQEVTFWYE